MAVAIAILVAMAEVSLAGLKRPHKEALGAQW